MSLFCLCISTAQGQTPLSVDQDTLALWNFDSDVGSTVSDSGINNIHGIALNSPLLPFPNAASFASSRFFNDEKSVITLGTLSPGSPLDILDLEEWSIEVMVRRTYGQLGQRNLFDNGQVKLEIIDNRYVVSVNRNGTDFAVSSERVFTSTSTNNRVSVSFNRGVLSLAVDGRTEGTGTIPREKHKRLRRYGQLIRLGGNPVEGTSGVFLGRDHSCLKTEANKLKCWGRNDRSQLGDRTTFLYTLPVTAEGITNVVAASLGDTFTCAIRNTGVECWGSSDYFTLGTAVPGPFSRVPLIVPDVANPLEIKSGRTHTCALLPGNAMKCWGRNEQGQLGTGTFYYGGFPSIPMNFGLVKGFATGSDHTCAVTTTGTVYCWGLNDNGQIGQPTSTYPTSAFPLQVAGLSNIDAVAAGESHTCALRNDKVVFCWGLNSFGQLGNGTTVTSHLPVQVNGLSNSIIASLHVGQSQHSCVRETTGGVKCWGRNNFFQLGQPANLAFSSTAIGFPGSNQTSFVVGARNNCSQRGTAALYCNGSNTFGLLGTASPAPSSQFSEIVLSTHQGQFPGYLDDIRISDVARFTPTRPMLNLVAPAATSTNPYPTIQISVSSSSPLDPTLTSLRLGDSVVTGLVLSGNTLQGQLNLPLKRGRNILQVRVGDTSGNQAFYSFSLMHSTYSDATKPMKISSHLNNGCYVNYAGELWCWGSNSVGQLGSDVKRHSTTPVKNIYLERIIDVAVTQRAICAVDENSAVWCWGDNYDGLLGLNENGDTQRSFPEKVDLGAGLQVSKLLAGLEHFCAILTNGKVKCWGDNWASRYGLPSGTYSVPTEVPNLSQIVDAGLGTYHSCFIDATQNLWCVGYNINGQIGDGTYETRVTPVQVPLNNITAVSTSFNSTCAINSTKAVYCWGENYHRQLGSSTSTDYNHPAPVLVDVLFQAEAIYTGEKFACAIATGSLNPVCWGQNTHGEMGNGVITRNELVRTQAGLQATMLSAGGNTVCSLNLDKSIYCWGANSAGQAGNNGTVYTMTPRQVVANLQTIPLLSQLVTGQANSCMKVLGETYCWGNNENAQIGTRSGNFAEHYPVRVTGFENTLQSSVGYGTICHLSAGKEVFCAGFNNFGQAGQAPPYIVDPLLRVGTLSNMKQVAAGLDFSCAIGEDKSAFCWGNNSVGQIGAGTLATHVPNRVSNLIELVSIDVAERGQHACGIDDNGQVICWGSNSNGQIGARPSNFPDTRDRVFYAIDKLGMDNAEVSLGSNFTCVLKLNGKVICFGSNAEGQLGTGDRFSNASLKAVDLAHPVTKIAAGENHVCVLDVQHDVYCWGGNQYGQLGIGTTIGSANPTKVLGRVNEIASGAEHTCALTQQNKLACWGTNINSQFGNGTNISTLKPTLSDVTKK